MANKGTSDIMSNEKQTAVEWLVKQLQSNIDIRWRGTNIIELGEQAKEMEKEQIMSAYNNCELYNPEQYYEKTYGGNK
jgi:HEPN domain-containing protein